jgi:hypothetical protein
MEMDAKMETVVRASHKPYRPFPVKVINGIGRGLGLAGLVPVSLKKDDIITAAVRKAGFNDFGDFCDEALQRVCDSLENEADLTLLGRIMARGCLVNNLANRLQIIQWRKDHPEVEQQEIRKPLFINGLPRTGTTILHALLDVDPANRSPLFWEVEYPVPPAVPETWTSDSRIAEDQKALNQLFQICPGFEAVHPMGATMPQECVAIFTMEMLSESLHATFNIPSYCNWLDDQTLESAYHWHRMTLQHFQSGGVVGERWLLKSPCHLHLVDSLLAEYPDANIIHTHRNPVEVCVSSASLMAMLRGVASDNIDLPYIGRQQIEWWSKLLKIGTEQRKRHADKKQQFFDQKMSDTVADPIGSVDRIYDHFGYELTAEVKKGMEQYMRDHRRDKHGSHTYTAADFDIDLEKDRKNFAEYCEYFGV